MTSTPAISDTELSTLHTLAIEAAAAAGSMLTEGFGGTVAASNKEGRHNLVTEYDLRVEAFLRDFLTTTCPGSGFLGEELQATGLDSDLVWVVDPLDGTVNFAHGIPLFSVSIAARVGGQTVVGVVHAPVLGETFSAIAGRGATSNGRPLMVSTTEQLADSLLVTGFPYDVDKNPASCIDQFAAIVGRGLPIRRLGSAALDLAYVAAGRFDGYWEVQLQPWDMAAGVLLVREAGGTVTHYGERPFVLGVDSIIATNGHIHSSLAAALVAAQR